jgi:hypothetical protein
MLLIGNELQCNLKKIVAKISDLEYEIIKT